MKRFIPLILLEGATVMAVELSGAKLLAPLYGTSLYVWAAILAITLAALAGGYYLGGRLSKTESLHKLLWRVISFASFLIALMPFISFYILPRISYLPFSIAVIISALCLIFLPLLLLGCTSPMFIRLNSKDVNSIGLVSGKVYSISTIGGIFSTVLCGFSLIPYLGLKFTLLGFSLALFICAAITLKTVKFNSLILLFVSIVASFNSYAVPKNAILFEHGIMGEIEVLDVKSDSFSVRKLLINQIVQSEMELPSRRNLTAYIHLLDSIITPSENNAALVIGLGGGMVANMLIEKKYTVDGVEFDERIIDAAKNYFYLNKRVNVFCQDGRFFINHCTQMYDVILLDVFKGEEQPSHIITTESIGKLKTMLNPGGKIIVNWHGYYNLPVGLGTHIVINTFRNSEFDCEIVSTNSVEDFSNSLLIFTKSINPLIKSELYPLNSDDTPILEIANAEANLKWRKNYLRFYQGTK